MRYHQLLSEAVTSKDLVLYHGTKSEPFDAFDGGKAAKGDQYFNPLGDGMYATDSVRFAQRFGSNIHRVIIPAGSSFKRITNAQWAKSVGRNIVFTALKLAFKAKGQDFNAWANGTATEPEHNTRKMATWQVVDAYFDLYPAKRGKVSTAALSPDDVAAMKKAIDRKTPRYPMGDAQERVEEFREKLQGLLDDMSPYESLRDSVELVDTCFDLMISIEYQKLLPQVSNAVFKKYDFVVFTDTADYAGTGKNGGAAHEIVIFNPALQRAQGMSLSDRINAMAG